jgi:hypothetical protein
VRIVGNAIHDNGTLGIDLITNGLQTGVTPNDALDADGGGNGLQNYPVLQSADRVGDELRVVGSLNSTPSSSFTLEFFASPQCDGSGSGEGHQPLGLADVSTNTSGNGAFDVILAAPVTPGWFVTATASATTGAAAGSTSEFSACVPASGAWVDLGQGLAGVAGIPDLVGTGPLTAASPGTLLLSNAAPASLALLFSSLSSTPTSFKCGTLVPVPAMLQVPLFTNGGGSIPLGWASWPGGLSGASLYFQYAIADVEAECGVSLSNALRADVP